MAGSHYVKGHYRGNTWVRGHMSRNPTRSKGSTKARSGGIAGVVVALAFVLMLVAIAHASSGSGGAPQDVHQVNTATARATTQHP